jgi:hypothetical protein
LELLSVKMISSTYTKRNVISLLRRNKKKKGSKVEETKPIWSSISFSLWYHALGDWRNPYNALFSLQIWLGKWESTNLGGCDMKIASCKSPCKKALLMFSWWIDYCKAKNKSNSYWFYERVEGFSEIEAFFLCILFYNETSFVTINWPI